MSPTICADGAKRLRRNTEVFWFSSLHFFSKELSECRDPQQIVDQSLRGALEMLDTQEGYLLVHEEEGDEGKVHCSIRGISAQGAERLSQDPLRRFVLSSGERWGALMVFPDLRRSEVVAAWQRDPVFHEFRDVLRSEGLRTLVVVGLQVREKSYGALILGFRSTRSFEPQELRVALAIGNQVSVAIENWSLNRAAERREEELRILHRVGEALRATFDMNAQIEILRRELKGLMGGTNFGLALQDTAEGPLEVVVPFESAGAARHRARRAGEFAGAICAADPPAAVGGQRRSGRRAAVGVGAHESAHQNLVWGAPPFLRWIDGRAGAGRYGARTRGHQDPV